MQQPFKKLLDTQRDLWIKYKDDPRITWCCPGRHGYAKDLLVEEIQDFATAMAYNFGNKCTWINKRVDDTSKWPVYVYDAEFVAMHKVSPTPKRPWEWCGKTHIFKAWQEREREARSVARSFFIGDPVNFKSKHGLLWGVIVGVNKKTAKVYVEDRRQTWTVSYQLLERTA
jgi:hypothetical protein